jgi:hypothetical protein
MQKPDEYCADFPSVDHWIVTAPPGCGTSVQLGLALHTLPCNTWPSIALCAFTCGTK